jgi:hypothetical protein
MHRLRRNAAAGARRLLCFLLVWLRAVSADSGSACGRRRHGLLLREVTALAGTTIHSAMDWVGSRRANLIAWWIPQGAILAGLFLEVPVRTIIWIVTLGWMGTACILNARRCGRTHCRFTGPYYLAMILPVLALGSGIVSVNLSGWLVLGALIVLGSKFIWWATERALGKFS